MVSKCANPRCSAVFRYLQRGKLFGHEVPSPKSDETASNSEFRMSSRKIEFFWLCDDCASTMTLIFRKGEISVEPIKKVRAAAAD